MAAVLIEIQSCSCQSTFESSELFNSEELNDEEERARGTENSSAGSVRFVPVCAAFVAANAREHEFEPQGHVLFDNLMHTAAFRRT